MSESISDEDLALIAATRMDSTVALEVPADRGSGRFSKTKFISVSRMAQELLERRRGRDRADLYLALNEQENGYLHGCQCLQCRMTREDRRRANSVRLNPRNGSLRHQG